jgi:microcystin-dependent protein
MAEPFLGEIRIVSFNFAPKGWAECNGQFLPINQNQALFSLYGTTFGGDGRVTFALPNLRGKAPMHVGAGHVSGETGGQSAHTLTQNEMPQHTHTLTASGDQGDSGGPNGRFLSASLDLIYLTPQSMVPLAAGTVGNAGGSQAHNNMQPYSVLNFVCALQGIFPSPN